ncbi:PspA/IM30 family protein [Cytobacillus sp. Sa5YUA1]|uniref:PspA/IM30 family protein n=1 Tax=Cytobacillus stercorigallinarum TaxID=2762240 RepID=A0ABR8QSN4_9BACI|nr:PspA/IM30 family protein [Cytobacillus stercorigallinarum]MBD7938503.1 PspA/IM30 family protein [Cytobacillus stercorigallinarum]
MVNLLTRIKNTIVTDINEVLDKKESKNPIALLNQYLRQSEQETEKVKKYIERQYKLREEFRKELAHAMDMATKRKGQAEVAERAGEEELSTFAKTESQYFSERAEKLQTMVAEASEELGKLERQYEEMKHKLKDMQIRRMQLMGRENVTRAQVKMNKVLGEEQSYQTAYDKFNDMEKYISELEQKVQNQYFHNHIDKKIADLELKMKKDDSLQS